MDVWILVYRLSVLVFVTESWTAKSRRLQSFSNLQSLIHIIKFLVLQIITVVIITVTIDVLYYFYFPFGCFIIYNQNGSKLPYMFKQGI